MATLTEGELEFTFTGETRAMKFDDPTTHRLSHCMKAVDFMVEYADFVLFVEIKDPDSTQATEDRRLEFGRTLTSGKLTDVLTQKYRDSWLYQWAVNGNGKPIRYAVLLQLQSLQPPMLLNLTDALRRQLPIPGAPTWASQIAQWAMVLDMAAWNRLGIFGQVRRV